MIGRRNLIVGLVSTVTLVVAQEAGAHTVRICWYDEADGSTTFYARNYHGPQQPTGALVIDGVRYPFTFAALGRPPAITACQPVGCDTAAIPNAYLSVNVPHVTAQPHMLGVTCANDLSCGFPGCYPTPVDFSPECADGDLDGVCDDEDNCSAATNAAQSDADADTVGDACDDCPLDPLNDEDGDGACGDVDNCAAVANPDQADTDDDSLGDACDDCPSDPLNDEDGDGVCGDVDACSETTLPERVPTLRLGVNRFANVDVDGVFDTTPPAGRAPRHLFTIADTAGCSCEQIIAETGLGNGARKYGCTVDAMQAWIESVNP